MTDGQTKGRTEQRRRDRPKDRGTERQTDKRARGSGNIDGHTKYRADIHRQTSNMQLHYFRREGGGGSMSGLSDETKNSGPVSYRLVHVNDPTARTGQTNKKTMSWQTFVHVSPA